MSEPVNVLFVCLGNICRSPTAEGVFRDLVERESLGDRILIDSCGTGDWHVGKAPDSRATEAAARRGINIADLRARQFGPDDLTKFDYVLVMDEQNLSDVQSAWKENGGTEPELFLSYGASDYREVPDPYFGGQSGFELVLDLIEEASQGLLEDIRKAAL